jgi:ATP-dependent Zn protease
MSNTSSIEELPSDPAVSQMSQQNIVLEAKDTRVQKPDLESKPYNANEFSKEIQQLSASGVGTLPSRDIPMNTQPIMNDQQVQPNYIPQEKPTEDYVQNYADENEMMYRKYKETNRKDSLEILFEEFKLPIFIGFLFFIFQLPFVRKNMIKYLPFAFSGDGNYKLNGYIIVSVLFSTLFYVVNKTFDLNSS